MILRIFDLFCYGKLGNLLEFSTSTIADLALKVKSKLDKDHKFVIIPRYPYKIRYNILMKNTIQKISFVFAFCAVFAMFGASQAQAAVVMQTGSYMATTNSATLNGTYNTDGLSMDVWFSYADNAGFFNSIDTTHENVTGVNLSYSKTITGLTSGKRYYYRIMGEGHGLFPSGSTASFITDAVNTNAPAVMTTGAVNPSINSVNLTCAINTGSTTTADVYFEYGTSTNSLTSKTISQTLTTGANCTTYVSGLNSGTKYYYRAVATNSVGTTRAVTIGQFTTLTNGGGGGGTIIPPTISIQSASSVTAYSAVLPCTFSTGGDSSVKIYFEYIDTSNNQYTTPIQTYNTGASCAVHVSGLNPSTKYSFQAIAENSVGSTGSMLQYFTTLPMGGGGYGAPTVSTGAVYNISTTSANVSCVFTTGGYPTADVYFEYGQNGNFYNRTQPQTLSTGASCINYISGLIPNTTYIVRAVISNNGGVVYGYSMPFTTLSTGGGNNGSKITTVTVLAKSATTKSIVVSGIVYGTANNVRTWFEYGTTTALGMTTAQQYTTVNNMQVYTATISGLKPGTTYYYRAVAMDQGSVSRGDINYVKTLTTTGSAKVETGTAVKSNKTILEKASDPFNFGNGQGAAALFGFGSGFFPTSLFGWLLLTFMLLLLIVLTRHYFAKKKDEVKK